MVSGWRLFDDSRVSDVLEDRVVNDQAYLLIYRRRDCPFELPQLPPVTLDSNILQENDTFLRQQQMLGNATYGAIALPSSEPASFALPETPMYNMHIAQQHDTHNIVNTYDGINTNNATSTINTNNASCGNLVSNINIDDTPSEQSNGASGFFRSPRPTSLASSNVFVTTDSFGNDSNLDKNPAVDSVDTITLGDEDISQEPLILDEVTPMSMSSASQPSLSSTEEESLGTAQDELD